MSETFQYHELDEATYHAHPALSVSTAKRLLEDGGPARVKWDMDHGREDSRVFDFGHAAHSLALGVGAGIVDIGESRRSKAAQAAEEEARAAGQTPLVTSDASTVTQMATALRAHPAARELLTGGDPEVSMFAQDERTGAPIRGRADYMHPDGRIVDYKTTQAASEYDFTRSVIRYGYHIQAAWYLELARLCGLPAEQFLFVVQEKKAPYLVHVVELDREFLTLGKNAMARSIDIWIECKKTGIWPGYSPEVTTLSPPLWAFDDEDLEIVI